MCSKLVVLNLENGDLNEGFAVVTASLWATGDAHPATFKASLPSAPEISELHRNWWFLYKALSKRLNNRSAREIIDYEADDIEISEDGVMNVSEADLDELADRLRKSINAWLNSELFHNINYQLRTELSRNDEIRVIVETDNDFLQRLPWHLWNFFKDYPKAEVALGARESRAQPTRRNPDSNVKILAILGNSNGINIQADRELLQKLPGATPIFLPTPQRREINDRLWEQGWDILFFAGHSESNGDKGRIYINNQDSLTIEQLKFALRKAVDRGLQLAIFNSCDGLGLARALAELHIPQIIVMREPVPDRVAQEFLKYFLEEYSKGKSLYLAVREARERLQGLEDEFRCATWLPVIYQNPAAVPLSWEELRQGARTPPPPHPLVKRLLKTALIASMACCALVLGVRHIGWLQVSELQAYDLLMRSRPDENVDPRLLVIAVTEDDLKYQTQLGMEKQGSLADAALSQILKKLQPLQPRAIGLFIYRDFPVKPSQAELATQLKNPNFFAICKSSDPTTNNPGVSAPPEVPQEQLGFTEIITDNDGILRRHLWYANFNSNSPCKSEMSFSLQLALHYLEAEKIEVETTPEGYLRVGKVLLKRLESRAGGYQGLDNYGYQMLLNYRSRRIAEQVTLKQILNGEFNPALVKDRIVIIGTTAPSYKDDYYTPYSENLQPDQSMRGVFVQAQIVSQIISAVKDNRPLLGVWAWWGDTLWIWGWALTGGLLACYVRRKVYLGLGGGVALAVLYGVCFILFIRGTWVPLVPSALALIGAGGSAIGYNAFLWQRRQALQRFYDRGNISI